MFKKYLKIKTLNVKIDNDHITNVSILNKLVVSLVLTSIISGNPDLTGYVITLVINNNVKNSNIVHWEILPRYMQRLWLKKNKFDNLLLYISLTKCISQTHFIPYSN